MPTVLVVDDLLADRRLVGGLLERQSGTKVLYAENGAQALEQIELHAPDMVITDLVMPDMDGIELVTKIRDDYPLIPTILITGEGSEETAVEALRQGAASYVPKKILANELVEICERVLAASTETRGHNRLMNRLTEYHFTLENDLPLLSSAVSHIRASVRGKLMFTDNDCIRIGTAIDEALMNAYYHGNLEISSELRLDDHNQYHDLARKRVQEDPYQDRKIHVEVCFRNDQATFRIVDEGPGFDPESLPDPTSPEALERPCGRGLLLMRAFMDEVQFSDRGNEVFMRKNRTLDAE
jgi:CheY-like chemotaxis protein/anti-sigma regulatory factor (Ser/Thr protein kinase)